jgi:hypothetical protein
MAGRFFVMFVRAAGIAVFALVVIAGLIGNQSPFKNIAPTMVWVIGWVGLSFASALIGDVWTVLNPWDSVARFVARRRQRGNPPRSNSDLPLSMRWLDASPGVVIFLLFAWCELIWDGSDEPRSLALALLGYSALTWAGMLLFGRPQWLQRGEIFSLAFGLFSRFAPLETVDDGKGARLVLRPYAAGLLSREPESPAPPASCCCFWRQSLSTAYWRLRRGRRSQRGSNRVASTRRPSPRLASSAFLWRTSAFIWSRLG